MTSATVVVFGAAVWDPVVVMSRLGNPIAVVVAMIALLLATLNVNVAANVVSPANDFSNLYPRRISFKMGGLITCLLGTFDAAVEADVELWELYCRVAGGVFELSWADCGSDDRGLLHGAEENYFDGRFV